MAIWIFETKGVKLSVSERRLVVVGLVCVFLQSQRQSVRRFFAQGVLFPNKRRARNRFTVYIVGRKQRETQRRQPLQPEVRVSVGWSQVSRELLFTALLEDESLSCRWESEAEVMDMNRGEYQRQVCVRASSHTSFIVEPIDRYQLDFLFFLPTPEHKHLNFVLLIFSCECTWRESWFIFDHSRRRWNKAVNRQRGRLERGEKAC